MPAGRPADGPRLAGCELGRLADSFMEAVAKRRPLVAQEELAIVPVQPLLPAFCEEELAEEQVVLGERPAGALEPARPGAR